MKVEDAGFKTIMNTIVFIQGDCLLKALSIRGIQDACLIGGLCYCYVDHEQGILFELLALKLQKNKEIEYRLVPDSVSLKLPKREISQAAIQVETTADKTLFMHKINWILQSCKVSKQIEELREFSYLDRSRHSEFPDDVMVYFLMSDQKPEAAWVRLESYESHVMNGRLLTKLHADFGYVVGDRISFRMTELEDGTMACVHIEDIRA